MHFGRSHARSKSRSPAPSSVGAFSPALSPRPPAFLPPSHYAAAAGLPYSGDTHGNFNPDYATSDHYSASSPVVYPTRPEPESAYIQSGEPSAYSEGSIYQPAKLTSKRSTTSLVSRGFKGDKDKRKSQLGDIPLLETQLLPSLRDTVDRMTQLPKKPMESSGSLEMKAGQSQQSLSSRIPRSTPDHAAIPRMRSQASPVPKSALKSPARRAADHSPSQTALRSPHPQGKSLRTPRSYDISTPIMLSHEPDHQGQTEHPRAPSTAPRSAPKAASGLPKLRPSVKSKSNPGTPRSTHGVPAYATPQPGRPSAPPSSSLPRPMYAIRDQILDDSGSELERQVGRAFSPGRLVITNAVIVPSSSESDHGAKMRNRRSQWLKGISSTQVPSAPPRLHSRQPSRAHPHRDACVVPADPPKANRRSMGVGLGLNVGGGFGGARERFAIDRDDDDEASIYEDDFDSRSPILQEPIPAALSGDDEDSIYEQELQRENAFGKRSPLPQRRNSPEARRRQEALLGIVDGLHRDYGDNSGGEYDDAMVHSESEGKVSTYGLAMGGSTDLQNGSPTGSAQLPRTSSRNRPPRPFSGAQFGNSDDESAYSEHDEDRERHVPHSSRHQNSQSTAVASGEAESRIPRVGPSPASLRQSRSSWKRPPSSLCVQDDPSTGRHSPSGSSSRTRLDRHRSASPLPAPSGLHPCAQDSGRVPSVAHQRSRSRHQPASPKPDANSSNRRSLSRVSSGESASRSSRLLSASPRASGGHSPRIQDDASSRERLSFGIPESLSYCGNVTPDEPKLGVRPPLSRVGSASSAAPGLLSRADSDLSVADAGWQDQARISKELSKGAAALFDALASSSSHRSPRMQQHALHDGDYEQDTTPQADHDSWGSRTGAIDYSRQQSTSPGHSGQLTRRRSFDSASISSRSSPPSEYDDQPSPVSELEDIHQSPPPSPPRVLVQEEPSSWKSTLSTDVYCALSRHYGPTEMDRQELIYALFTSEQAFVKSARRVVRTILLPLRARDSHAWLPGLPADVARLFDWLEDIVNLHGAVAHALSTVTAIWRTGSIVQRLAGTLKGFVPQFEMYMPYLAKYEGVRDAVRWHAEQDGGEFGEYLRMREREREEGSWSLERLFEEPAVRLRGYLDIFQRLHELTASEHPDHLVTLSLLYSTRTAVRVMDEVRLREEEYDFVKELSARIDGLPNSPSLARRARRLLWFGMLDTNVASAQPTEESSHIPTPLPNGNTVAQPSPNQKTLRRGAAPADRNPTRLASAIRDWATRRSRAGSFNSSVSSALSVQTYDTTSSSSGASVLVTPRSDQFHGLRIPMRTGSNSKGHSRSAHAPGPPTTTDAQAPRNCEGTQLNVMVFSDLLVLAVPNPQECAGGAQGDEEEQRSRLLAGVGLSRILGVTDQGDGSIILSLIPIPADQLDTGITVENTSPTSITLSIPPSQHPAPNHDDLLKALRKCHHHTVRGLSYPALPAVITDDLELDTRQSLVGILQSGLPLPKSPSMQFEETSRVGRSGEEDTARGEREERGWWTLRFQQVLRELQREEVPVAVGGQWAQGNTAATTAS